MEVVWIEPGHAFGVVGPTLVQVWETVGPDIPRMTRIRERLKLMRASGGPVFMLAIIAEASPIPDNECRKFGATLPAFFDHYVGVHEGASFRQAVVRAVLVGMAMVGSVRARYDVCSNVEDGVRKICNRSVKTGSEAELRRSVEELRVLALGDSRRASP